MSGVSEKRQMRYVKQRKTLVYFMSFFKMYKAWYFINHVFRPSAASSWHRDHKKFFINNHPSNLSGVTIIMVKKGR